MVATLLAAGIAGCGGNDGPPRYQVTGSVTYDGQPVPGGRVLFTPDRGNTGPASVAEIVEGKYETRSEKGVIGGPHSVTIYGTDGTVATEQHDNTLFSDYTQAVELPSGDSTMNFEIPRMPSARN
jgi:hypothetical protein